MTTKFAFNALTGQFDLVTATLTPSEVIDGQPLTVAGYDVDGTLSNVPNYSFEAPLGLLRYSLAIDSPLAGFTTLSSIGASVNVDQTSGINGLFVYTALNNSSYPGGSNITGKLDLQAGSTTGYHTVFRDDTFAVSGSAADNGFASAQFSPVFEAGSSLQNGFTGISVGPEISADLGTNGITLANLGGTSDVTMNYYNGLAVNPQFNTGLNIVNGYNAVSDQVNYTSGSTASYHSSFTSYANFHAGSTITSASMININPTIDGSMSNLTLGNFSPSGSASVGTVSGLSINLSGVSSPNRKIGINLNDGVINFNSSVVTQPNLGVDSVNSIVPQIHIESGTPISNTTVFGQNFANFLLAEDDFSNGPLDTALAAVAFVSNVSIASGKTVEGMSMAFSGLQLSGDGVATDVALYDALGAIPGTGSPTITNLYGLRIGGQFSNGLATNYWGVHSADPLVPHLLAGEVKTEESFVMQGGSFDVKLKASASTTGNYTLTLPVDDGTSNQVLTTNGSGVLSWSTPTAYVSTVTASAPLASSGGLTPNITITQSSTSVDGYLSATDWNIFNNKQAAGNYITALTGDVTASGPGSVAATIAAGAVDNSKVSASAAIAFSKLAALTSAHILVGNGSNVATDVAVTGDIAITNAGVTSYNGVVPIAKGGTNNGSLSVSNGSILYADGTKVVSVAPGTSGQILQTNGAGAPSWTANGTASIYNITSQSSTYSASINDYVICSGASFVVTLPSAVSQSGRSLVIQHNGTSLTQVYTLNTTSAQTIGGIASGSYALYTNGETLNLVSDGANWQITTHKAKTADVSAGVISVSATSAYVFTVTAANATVGAVYSNNSFTYTVTTTIAAGVTLTCSGTGTPTTSGTLTKVSGTGDATITFASRTITGVPVKGTTSTDSFIWSRDGQYANVRVQYRQTGAGTAGSGDYVLQLPTGFTMDTSLMTLNTTVYGASAVILLETNLGSVWTASNAPVNGSGAVFPYTANIVRLAFHLTNAAGDVWSSGANQFSASSMVMTANFRFPVLGWQP